MSNLNSRLSKLERKFSESHFDAYVVYKDYFSGKYKNYSNGGLMTEKELSVESKNKSTIIYITDFSNPPTK